MKLRKFFKSLGLKGQPDSGPEVEKSDQVQPREPAVLVAVPDPDGQGSVQLEFWDFEDVISVSAGRRNVKRVSRLRLKQAWLDAELNAQIGEFLQSGVCILDDESASTSATSLYSEFRRWWKESGQYGNPPSQKRVGRLIGRRFRRYKYNTMQYAGIKLNVEGA